MHCRHLPPSGLHLRLDILGCFSLATFFNFYHFREICPWYWHKKKVYTPLILAQKKSLYSLDIGTKKKSVYSLDIGTKKKVYTPLILAPKKKCILPWYWQKKSLYSLNIGKKQKSLYSLDIGTKKSLYSLDIGTKKKFILPWYWHQKKSLYSLDIGTKKGISARKRSLLWISPSSLQLIVLRYFTLHFVMSLKHDLNEKVEIVSIVIRCHFIKGFAKDTMLLLFNL